MWATADDERRLVAPTPEVAAFVSAVYRFDRTEVTPLEAELGVQATQAGRDEWRLAVSVPELALELALQAGAGWRIPFFRPPWFTRWVEAPVARRLLGVRAYGVSPTGVAEWYRADAYRPVVAGEASLAGRDLGAVGPLDPPVGFGFSEPPRGPSMVSVRPLLEDRSGVLASVLRSTGPLAPSLRRPQRPRPRRGRA
ncbi:MAG TPA: hypothetical protein VE760_04890 [Acidimicrobiales bacterium]|jgi:hypothetical protein|nr:hypothetical protein [Acidimicrobiales bacterium]